MPIQFVTLVSAGGTPVRLANQKGAPFPTTGTGALVFADAPTLNNPILNGYVITNPPIGLPNGSISAPSIYWGTSDRGLYSTGAGNLRAVSGGVVLWSADAPGDFRPGRNLLLNGITSGTTTLQAASTAGGTLTLPAATDILVARATTDTLTNKTIDTDSNTITGTNASATTFLRGDNTWATPAGAAVSIGVGTTTVTGGTTTRVLYDNAGLVGEYAQVPVAVGGTGASSLTANGLLLGNGTAAVGATVEGATGQLLVGSTGSPPGWEDGSAAAESTGMAYTVADLAALKALTTRPPVVEMEGGAAVGDGKGRTFYWFAGDTTPTDDDYIVSPTSGEAGRYKAKYVGVLSGGFSAWANILLEQNPGDLATLMYTADAGGQLTGIYPHNSSHYVGISTTVSAANDPPDYNGTTPAGDTPRSAFTTVITNDGSIRAADAFLTVSNCIASNTRGFGGNPIAMTTVTDGTVTLTGMEIDVMWPPGTTVADAAGSAGLIINGFNSNHCGQAILIGTYGDADGRWDNGIGIGYIRTDGAALYAWGPHAMNAFVDTRSGSFTTSAILLGNDTDQSIRFEKAAGGLAALLWADTNDDFNISAGSEDIRLTAANTFAFGNLSVITSAFGYPLSVTTGANSGGLRITTTTSNNPDMQMFDATGGGFGLFANGASSGQMNIYGVDSGGSFVATWATLDATSLTLTGGITVGSTTLITTSTALSNGAAANTGTLTNAPTAGNPTKWIPINDNGTTRYIPAW
ncbi:MAG: hypothetical protein ACOY4R_27850 [Pseudomonadota bacterium]